MKCPCCPNKLESDHGDLVKCIRGHRFHVKLGSLEERILVVAIDPPDKCKCKKGDKFPVPKSETFD